MRKEITRTIVSTVVQSVVVTFENGKPVITENAPLTLIGTVKEDKLLKEVRKIYGPNANITSVVSESNLFEISVEDFMKHASKVVEEASEDAATEV